jgi:hypothetical protein
VLLRQAEKFKKDFADPWVQVEIYYNEYTD